MWPNCLETDRGESRLTRQEFVEKDLDLPGDIIAATQDIHKVFSSDGIETVALRGVTIGIHEKEMLAMIGPSGSGKSTLLGILGGTVEPTSGSVYWSACKCDISRLNPEKVMKLRRRFIGFVSQDAHLLPQLTTLQNVEIGARIAGLSRPRDRAEQILKRVGLSNRTRSFPQTLSSGEKQRVAISCAIVNSPRLVLADEPTGNLDEETGGEILELFRRLNQEIGTAFFTVTHSQEVASRASRTIEIKDGTLSGLHRTGIDIKDLEKTRILTLDNVGRLTIPKHVLDQYPNTKTFHIKTEKGEIILTPYSDECTETAIRTRVCNNCARVVREESKICPHCGQIL